MERTSPLNPNPNNSRPSLGTVTGTATPSGSAKRKLPTAKELISHYESQGLESREASMKVIEDLQKALFGVVSSGRGKKDRILMESSRKIDALNNRLVVIDMKLDSKPGYAEAFAIGVVSGAALKGIGAMIPHVFAPLAHIWNTVANATKSCP